MQVEKTKLMRNIYTVKEKQWYHPLKAMTDVVLKPDKKNPDGFKLVINFDKDLQNEILV